MKGDSVKFRQLANESKNGQRDVGRTLLGINDKSIFTIDPRAGDESIIEGKTYKTPVNFTTVSTSANGGFALGNASGEIRLYK